MGVDRLPLTLASAGAATASPRGLRAGALLALWAFVSVLSVGPTYLHYLAQRQPVPWSRLFSEVTGWYLWVLVFPLVLWAVRRFPLDGRRWRVSLAGHLLIGSGVAVLYGLLALLKSQAIFAFTTGNPDADLLTLLPGYVLGGFQFYLLIYWMLAAAVFAVDYYRKYRQREMEALELEARLSRAHLQMLKMQLEPHFLFNTLNAISALLHSEPEKADRMVGLLGDLLRSSLRESSGQEATLADELELLRHYLEIEEVRFGKRLVVAVQAEPEALAAAVPTMMLQPIVENCIRHGLDSRSGTLTIEVTAREQARTRLEIRVLDDGPGFQEPVADALSRGIGLSNTSARLQSLYGPHQELELGNRAGGGASVTISIPLRPLEKEEATA